MLRLILCILAGVAILFGVGVLTYAQDVSESAIHEIEALILFLIGAVFISGAGVVEAVNLLRKEVVARKKGDRTD